MAASIIECSKCGMTLTNGQMGTPIARVMLCRREVTDKDVEAAKLAFLRHKERISAAPGQGEKK